MKKTITKWEYMQAIENNTTGVNWSALGEDGWELVSSVQRYKSQKDNIATITHYFKRRKIDSV